MTTEEQANPPADDSASPKAKVFVGNLSFRTRSKGLRETFEAVGAVDGARVVTQGKRSMGYGFVQFSKLEDAQKAVEQLHKSDLDGRDINVEISTSLNTNVNPSAAVKRRPRKRPAGRKTDSSGENNSEGTTSPVPAAEESATGSPQAGGKAPLKKRRRRASKKSVKSEGSEPEVSTSPVPTTDTGDAEGAKKRPAKKPAVRKPRAPKPVVPASDAPPAAERVKREPRPPREVSVTVLYVSNIPFSLDDDALKEAFAEFDPVSANVIRRKRNNLSKGFGFVEFSDPAKQQSALDAKHKSKVGDRDITVRKAHLRTESDEVPQEESAETKPAAAADVETKAE